MKNISLLRNVSDSGQAEVCIKLNEKKRKERKEKKDRWRE
jgi:hypothetical protein